MKKEKIKTLILIVLIVNGLFLTSQIWFSKKLWSLDYSLYTKEIKMYKVKKILSKIFPTPKKENQDLKIENLAYSPQSIVVSFGGVRTVYVNEDDEYKYFLEELFKSLDKLLKSEADFKYSIVETEEWFSALKAKSFYMLFSSAYRVKLLGQLFGIKDTSISNHIKDVKEVIIVPGDSASNNIVFYMKNYTDDSIIKFPVNYDKTNLNKMLSEYQEMANTRTRYKFSFEMDYHKKTDLTNFIINTDVLIPLNTIRQYTIKAINPIKSDYDTKHILKAFKHSINTPRKYIEMDNTNVFIENESTLKIHPEGFIEYDVIGDGRGLQLKKVKVVSNEDTTSSIRQQQSTKDSNIYSLRESLDAVVSFIKDIHDGEHTIKLIHVMEDSNRQGSYEFAFNYNYNGLPIINSTFTNSKKESYGNDIPEEGIIKINMVNGAVKSYRHYVRNYEVERQVNINVPIPYVLDNIYKLKDVKNEDIKINNIYLSYEENDEKEILKPQWSIRLEKYNELVHMMVDIK